MMYELGLDNSAAFVGFSVQRSLTPLETKERVRSDEIPTCVQILAHPMLGL
jgi:hypothetical protein